MYTHDDCMCKSHEDHMSKSKDDNMYKLHEGHMYKSKEYARAYILPQKYENLFSCKEGFLAGTIFKDLYRPYPDHKHEYEHDHDHCHDCKKNKC